MEDWPAYASQGNSCSVGCALSTTARFVAGSGSIPPFLRLAMQVSVKKFSASMGLFRVEDLTKDSSLRNVKSLSFSGHTCV